MMQKSEQHRPYGRQTMIYNWFEERADVKSERIQKPLPSQVSVLNHLKIVWINTRSFLSV